MLGTASGTCSRIQAVDRTSHDGHLERCRPIATSGQNLPNTRSCADGITRKATRPRGGSSWRMTAAALIIEGSDGGWLSLEDGVQIQFQPGPPAHMYRTGDYWLIPARTATADVDWPTEPAKDGSGNPVTVPIALPPAGVQHHYAPLALVTVDANGDNHGTSSAGLPREVRNAGGADTVGTSRVTVKTGPSG